MAYKLVTPGDDPLPRGIITTGLQYSWEDLPQRQTLDIVTHIPRPQWMAFARRPTFFPNVYQMMPDEVEKFNSKLIVGMELLYSDPASASNLLASVREGLMVTIRKLSDPAVVDGELDIADKLSIQRRVEQYWFMQDHDPGPGEVNDEWRRILRLVMAHRASLSQRAGILGQDPIRLVNMDFDPMDTNQGWPSFSKDPLDRLLLCRAMSFKGYPILSDFLTESQQLFLGMDLPADLGWPCALAKRTGPTKKAIPIWEEDREGLISAGSAVGIFCRGRIVYMGPFMINMMTAPLAMELKAARLSIYGFNHSTAWKEKALAISAERERAGMIPYEADISGFDKSIWPELRLAVWEEARAAGFNADACDLMTWYDDPDMGNAILSAPWMADDSSMAVYNGRCGLRSGLKITSELNSLIAQVSMYKALIRAGHISDADITSDVAPFFNQGDDILYFGKPGLDPELVKASFAEEGLELKLIPGRRFLMQHIKDGVAYGIISRVAQQTLANEDSYGKVGQVLLGLAARLSRPFMADTDESLAQVEGAIRSTGIGPYLPPEPIQSWSKILMASQLVRDFVLSAEGQEYLINLLDQANYSASAADAIALLGKTGWGSAFNTATTFRAQLVSELFGGRSREDKIAAFKELWERLQAEKGA